MSQAVESVTEVATESQWKMDSKLIAQAKEFEPSEQLKRVLPPITEKEDYKPNDGNLVDDSQSEKESLKRLVDAIDNAEGFDVKFGSADQKDCAGCKNCNCNCENLGPLPAKRRCSTSDINFKASDLFANPNILSMKRPSVGSHLGRSSDKIDKINLANLVFNPNFKNSAGCVNLPVIRAGQNLAQKNAQRSAMTVTKETPKEESDLDLTQQAAIDLLAKQLQPQALTKLNLKLQQMAQQKKTLGQELVDAATGADVGEIIQTFTGRAPAPTQSNALRYKTELCRSYEEGGDCRFGSGCTFAHGQQELRPVPRHPLYKTEFCRTYHQHGYCQYGTRCHFIHDADEADKNAPLKGCKSWGRHDQLSGALLSLAQSSGLLEQQQQAPENNDVLLANLRRLYALRQMNAAEKQESNQFSMSQPMAQQLSMAHQQIAGMSASQHLPMSMTQPLPMEALQLGLQRAAQQQRAPMGHVPTNNRVESLANDYAPWGINNPLSPTFAGISPFGAYQQFSPLPHHQNSQTYPHYPFSATAPDLSAALAASPYGVSPQNFSNTVNVGHMLPSQEHNSNSYGASMGQSVPNASQSKVGGQGSHQAPATAPNPTWPATSAEVSSVIDKELFGFGLDSQTGYQHPYYQSMANQQSQSSYAPADVARANLHGQGVPVTQSSVGADLMNMINNDKYVSKDHKSLRPIRENVETSDEHGARPKMLRKKV